MGTPAQLTVGISVGQVGLGGLDAGHDFGQVGEAGAGTCEDLWEEKGGAPEQPPPQHEKGEDGRGRRRDVRWVRGWKGIRGHSERDKK